MTAALAFGLAVVVLNAAACIAYLLNGEWRQATYFGAGAVITFAGGVWA
jgi:hypothetical protein